MFADSLDMTPENCLKGDVIGGSWTPKIFGHDKLLFSKNSVGGDMHLSRASSSYLCLLCGLYTYVYLFVCLSVCIQ